jgi:YD repeat-containing protein
MIYQMNYTYTSTPGNKTCATATFDSAQNCTILSGNTATVIDPATHQRTLVSDAAGRVTSVTEDPGSSPHLNYQTTYQYNQALNGLSGVTQGSQTRTFVYL